MSQVGDIPFCCHSEERTRRGILVRSATKIPRFARDDKIIGIVSAAEYLLATSAFLKPYQLEYRIGVFIFHHQPRQHLTQRGSMFEAVP
jgi:hypothetical protein